MSTPVSSLFSDELILEIPAAQGPFHEGAADAVEEAGQESGQEAGGPVGRQAGGQWNVAHWRSHLNQSSAAAFLAWVRADDLLPQAKVWPNAQAIPSINSLVNGCAIRGAAEPRLVLIPTLALDTEELRVPQEWVDIPEWVADYYIALQVNPDEGWVRPYGYATHAQLKTNGEYDVSDRTYSLLSSQLTPDLNHLWVAQQLAIATPTRVALEPLGALDLVQAENLIARLANPAVGFPRLEVPFSLWGQLISHDGWRQRLYEQRQGLPSRQSVSQWLRTGWTGLAQSFGSWQTQAWVPVQAGARGLAPDAAAPPQTSLVRPVQIDGQAYQLAIAAMDYEGGLAWRFELRPVGGQQRIPAGVVLRLLTEDLQPFEHNEDRAAEPQAFLAVEVMVESGEGLVWEIEPTPEDYVREILKF